MRRINRSHELPTAISFNAVQHHTVKAQIHEPGEVFADDGFPGRVPIFHGIFAGAVGAKGLNPAGFADTPFALPLVALVFGIADVEPREYQAARTHFLELQTMDFVLGEVLFAFVKTVGDQHVVVGAL